MKLRFAVGISLALTAALLTAAHADTMEARCDIYPAGEDKLEKMIGCTFSQRQGYVTISREDGVVHELSPVGDAPGNFEDQYGRRVYRQSGLEDAGQIFRLPDESIFLYWSTAGLEPPSGEDNWTAPFSTADFDATTRLPCRAPGDSEFGNCPAGIARMDGGQASITVQNQFGEQFTMNFMRDSRTGKPYVNATNREVDASLEGDTWTVVIDKAEVWKVPLAAIEGG